MSEVARNFETPSLETSESSGVETPLSSTVVDVEKPGTPLSADNNHFFEEKVKERPPPGINGSLVFLYAIFFLEFTIGWINLNSCPINILIPIFLIGSGLLGAATKSLSKVHNKYVSWFNALLIFLNLAWHGLGTYEVYKEYQPNYDPDPKNDSVLFCNRTVYLMAFWILNFEYTMLFLFVALSGCYMMMRGDFRPTKT